MKSEFSRFDEYFSLSTGLHTRFYHGYHVVWATKYRHKVLEGAMRERIREIIIQVCAEMGVHIVKGVPARDYVHMFLSVRPFIKRQRKRMANRAFTQNLQKMVSMLVALETLGSGLIIKI